MPEPQPTHPEAVSAFRLSVVGDLLVRDLDPGELTAELKQRAQIRYRPPGSDNTRTFHWKTLQRWLIAARRGVRQLQPRSRQRGFALALDDTQRQTLLDVRRAHPTAAAELILSEAVRNGLVAEGQISVPRCGDSSRPMACLMTACSLSLLTESGGSPPFLRCSFDFNGP